MTTNVSQTPPSNLEQFEVPSDDDDVDDDVDDNDNDNDNDTSSISSGLDNEEITSHNISSLSKSEYKLHPETMLLSERFAKWFSFQTTDSIQFEATPFKQGLSYLSFNNNNDNDNNQNNPNLHQHNNDKEKKEIHDNEKSFSDGNEKKSMEKHIEKQNPTKKTMDLNLLLVVGQHPRGVLSKSILFSSPNVIKEHTVTYKRKKKKNSTFSCQTTSASSKEHTMSGDRKRKRRMDEEDVCIVPFGSSKKQHF
jgi:hypothetical protein